MEEVSLMIFFPFTGCLLFSGKQLEAQAYSLLISLIGIYFLFWGVYIQNNYFGFVNDRKNPRFSKKKILTRSHLLLLSTLFYVLGLLLFYFINSLQFYLSLIIIVLWSFYSHPKGAKGRPFLGMLVHFVGQIIHYHMISVIFTPISYESILVSIFFSLSFCFGHIFHELKDFDFDKKSGLKTTSIFLGRKSALKLGRGIIYFSGLYLIYLKYTQVVTLLFFTPFFIVTFLMTLWILLPNKNDRYQITSPLFQYFYRLLYLISGGTIFCVQIFL